MSRTRTRLTNYGQSTFTKTVTDSNGNVIIFQSFKKDLGQKYETCEDTSTPNYKQLIESGEIVNFAYIYTKQDYQTPSGSIDWATDSGRSWIQSGPSVNVAIQRVTESDVSVSQYYGESKCIANLDSTPYQMMEDVFEIRETLRFLKNPFSLLDKVTKKFSKSRRRKQRQKRLSRTEASASTWLEYRFALLPLISSVENILQSLHKEFEFPSRRTSRSSSGDSANHSVTHLDPKTGIKSESSITRTWGGRCGIGYTISNPAADWRSIYGLRAKDIPVTFWAIVPLSFMIDRMINISDSIQGLTNLADPNLTILYGWKTGQDEITIVNKDLQKTKGSSNTWFGSCSDGGSISIDFTHHRYPWLPSVSDTAPPIDLGGLVSDVTSIIDLLALFIQRLR